MEFVLLSLLSLWLSFVLAYNVSGSLSPTKLNLVTWSFYFSIIAQTFIASVVVVNGWEDHYRISNQLTNDSSRLYGWLSVQWLLFSLPLGMYVSTLLFGYKSNRRLYQFYLAKRIEFFSTRKESFIRLGLYFLSTVCLITVIYVFYKIGTFPQIRLFSISGVLASELRESVGRGFEGNNILRNTFGLTLTPILSYVWYAYYKSKPDFKNRILFLVFLLLSVVILTYNLAKAPVIFYLLGFVFLNVYINGQVSKKFLVTSFVLTVSLLVLFYYLLFDYFSFSHLFSFNKGIGGRVFLSQSMGLFFSFDIFPMKYDFIGFDSFSSEGIKALFADGSSERSARIVTQVIDPQGVEKGTAGVTNSIFLGEAWANFGFLGVLLSPFVVGFYIQSIFMFFLTSKKTPIYLGIFSYLSYRLPVVGGFNDFIYNPIHIFIIIIFLILNLISTRNRSE
ncbi:hypothetical protein [Idiomarina abyssalis]|uniref:hypothetical protein n=1 Tax=Idiomarina abyssalis TaxID=86102 RepID=UPI001CD19EFC|nr:hypothetical protein [Idiomarina abyssalis]